MKQYIALIRDKQTGEVKHLMTSDLPIDTNFLPEDPCCRIEDNLLEEFELESDRFVKAREFLDNVEFKRDGNNVNISLKPGKSLPVSGFKAKGQGNGNS